MRLRTSRNTHQFTLGSQSLANSYALDINRLTDRKYRLLAEPAATAIHPNTYAMGSEIHAWDIFWGVKDFSTSGIGLFPIFAAETDIRRNSMAEHKLCSKDLAYHVHPFEKDQDLRATTGNESPFLFQALARLVSGTFLRIRESDMKHCSMRRVSPQH